MTVRRDVRRVQFSRRSGSQASMERLDGRRLLAASALPVFAKHPVAIHADADPARWGTVDAPADWMTYTPVRTVMQTIDNRFHEWAEFTTPRGTFILTNQPERLVLSARESAGLLSASAAWAGELPAATGEAAAKPGSSRISSSGGAAGVTTGVSNTAAPDAPSPLILADPKARPADTLRDDPSHPVRGSRDVIGTDDRIRVTGTTSHPFNTVGYVATTFPGVGGFRGTGFLVSPFVALTNAHNIYDSDAAVYSSAMTFTPGQRQDSAGGAVTSPYGTLNAQSWQTNSAFIAAGTGYTNAHIQVDYAAMFFDRSWLTRGIGTFMPLAFDVTPGGAVNTVGYPRVVQGESNSQAQWRHFGTYSSVSGRILSYDNDSTGGNSGGPAYEFFSSDGSRRVVAIHSYGGASDNGGPRLVSQNQSLIAQWMAHAPAIASDRFEANNAQSSATSLGVVGFRREDNLTIHAGGNDDYFSFTPRFSGNTRIDALFTDLDGDIDIQLLNSSGTVIASSGGVADNELINASLVGGQTYTVRVYGYSGATNPEYDLVITAAGAYVDRFESNDSIAAATNFGASTAVFEAGLTIHATGNGDYYRLQTVGAGTLSINLSFAHIAGDIDVVLYDAVGNIINSSGGTTNVETINQAVTAGQTYTIYVFGYSGAINEYALAFTAPAPSPAPNVIGSAYLYETAQQVSIDFDRDVSPSLSAADLVLSSPGWANQVPASVSWNAGAQRATWTFTNQLGNGQWTARLPAGSVAGHGGGTLAADYTLGFHHLAGDANRDQTANFSDLLLLAQNYNAAARPYSQGNFDYSADGLVSFNDLLILARNYNSSVSRLADASIVAATPSTPGRPKGIAADLPELV